MTYVKGTMFRKTDDNGSYFLWKEPGFSTGDFWNSEQCIILLEGDSFRRGPLGTFSYYKILTPSGLIGAIESEILDELIGCEVIK